MKTYNSALVLAGCSMLAVSGANGAIVLELGTAANAGGLSSVTNVYGVDSSGVVSLTSSDWTGQGPTAESPTGDTGALDAFSSSVRSVSAATFTPTTGIELTTSNFAVNSRGISVSGGPGGNFTSSSLTQSEGNVFYFTIPTDYTMTISRIYLDAVNTFDAFDSYAVINGINDSTTGEIDIDEVAVPTQGYFSLAAPIVVTGSGSEQHVATIWNPGGTDGDAAGGWRVDKLEVTFTQVPEPSVALLGGLGLLGLLLRRRD